MKQGETGALEQDPASNALIGHSLQMSFSQLTFERTNCTLPVQSVPITKLRSFGSLRFCDLFEELFFIGLKLRQPLLGSGIQEGRETLSFRYESANPC